MYDQNDQQGQGQQPSDNTQAPPFGQAPSNDGALGVNHDQPTPSAPMSQPEPSFPSVAPPSTSPPVDAPAPAAPVVSEDLLNIKQEALQQLSPLVGQLDQSPEEKFKTTMMMIQASDDQSLVKAAYETAKQIPDEKARAQALLDVVNEINYFTQHNNKAN